MITLSKSLYSILSTNITINGLVGSRIYSLVAPANTVLPYITFSRSFQLDDSNYTYDGVANFDNSVDITIVSNTYSDGIGIAVAVNNTMNLYRGVNNGINIINCKLINGTEEYQDGDIFNQILTYSIKCI